MNMTDRVVTEYRQRFQTAPAFIARAPGRVNLLGAALGFMLAALLPVAIVLAASYGFFDALLERFVSDSGSANARGEHDEHKETH